MLLVVVSAPSLPDPLARAAAITGLSVADVQRRLAGILPRVLMLDADSGRLASIRAQLAPLGFVLVIVDVAQVPSDDQRIVARTLGLGAGELVVIEGVGAQKRYVIPAAAIDLLQRGARISSETKTTKSTERKVALGRAVMTGGLVLTKKVEKTETQKLESREPFVLVGRCDGGPDVILYEKRLDYRFLGKDMQPTANGNLALTLTKIRALAPAAPFDDRAIRPGFVVGLPPVSAEPVDLAVHLVRAARALEAPPGR